MRDPKQLRDKAFELRRWAIHARTDTSALKLIGVARELEAEASDLEREMQRISTQPLD